MKLKSVVLLSILVSAQVSQAQNFKLMRYDEDYSVLKDSVRTFYNRIKYIPLSQSGRTYLSLGGEVHVEVDRAQNEDWGARNTGRNIFALQRYHLHADLHLGDRSRFFGQLRSGLENGRKNGPRPIDEDQLNVQNLFVDLVQGWIFYRLSNGIQILITMHENLLLILGLLTFYHMINGFVF